MHLPIGQLAFYTITSTPVVSNSLLQLMIDSNDWFSHMHLTALKQTKSNRSYLDNTNNTFDWICIIQTYSPNSANNWSTYIIKIWGWNKDQQYPLFSSLSAWDHCSTRNAQWDNYSVALSEGSQFQSHLTDYWWPVASRSIIDMLTLVALNRAYLCFHEFSTFLRPVWLTVRFFKEIAH